MCTYLIVTVDDKVQSLKRCEPSAVIIRVSGSCWLGGCTYNLDCSVAVILQLIDINYVRSTKCDQGG